jgi:hypothetical protein
MYITQYLLNKLLHFLIETQFGIHSDNAQKK